jgi:hypothetical protein
MSLLVERLLAVHDALTAAKLPHAFGGAIALAYCTKEPRGTRDLDVNIFTDAANAPEALAALPEGVAVSEADVAAVLRDGQTRLWWDETPVDVFLNNHPFHREVAKGVRWVPLAGRDIPVLDCAALIVFKALFNRTKDWADIEAVVESGSDGPSDALAALTRLLGTNDAVVRRLAETIADSTPA